VGRQIRIAHAQVNDILAGLNQGALFLIDFDKQIRRKGLQTLRLDKGHAISS